MTRKRSTFTSRSIRAQKERAKQRAYEDKQEDIEWANHLRQERNAPQPIEHASPKDVLVSIVTVGGLLFLLFNL